LQAIKEPYKKSKTNPKKKPKGNKSHHFKMLVAFVVAFTKFQLHNLHIEGKREVPSPQKGGK
jgi:hypothetical protein